MQYILYVREVSDIVFVALSGDDSVLQGKKKTLRDTTSETPTSRVSNILRAT
jgi:hypothetical protein